WLRGGGGNLRHPLHSKGFSRNLPQNIGNAARPGLKILGHAIGRGGCPGTGCVPCRFFCHRFVLASGPDIGPCTILATRDAPERATLATNSSSPLTRTR